MYGTTVFGEAVIFSVAAVVIGFEYRRSQLKESMKEQKLQNDLTGLRHQLAEVHAENARITSSIASISTPNREVLPAHSANQAPEEHKASVNEALLSNVRRDTHKMSSHPGSNLMYASTTSRKVVADEEGEILLYSPSGVAITPSKKLTATHLPNGVIVKRLATDFASLPNAKSNTGNVNSD
ncbi:hypothetical protein IE077_002906 [Cardiosporidium cionae]|uniref:Uncharacterized protein n=1 Tax=Cardiosporidium cionae TaxID=476202 RepID=A0ABQ7J9L4_9APIC|nr:hypothetical protein IE077_002906 [Cardiosporidium cionae]|eukprot:KAF8820703.1 hypothetical protein IE077_002906 [Cardiosporidium cionae]